MGDGDFGGPAFEDGVALGADRERGIENDGVARHHAVEEVAQGGEVLLARGDAGRRPDVVARRDRALLAVLVYTASRAGAVAALKRAHFYRAGEQYMLHFREKGGKSREIPVRHDLQETIFAYLDAAGLRDAPKDTPLFQSAVRKEKRLSGSAIHVNDVCRMMKRRLRDAGLPEQLSPHSFRVTTITDLLGQGVPLEDVQRLAGHADPRTTRLYDRRDRKITRNVVERISV